MTSQAPTPSEDWGTIRDNVKAPGNGGQCLACSASWDGPPSRVHEPDAGSWRKVAELPAKGEGGRA